MEKVAVFDFDGTITRKDTLLEFIKFAKGNVAFYKGILKNIFILIAFKLKLYPNWKAKQKIFTYFFKGITLEEFDRLCEDFFIERHNELLYASALKQIQEYVKDHVNVIIVSASIENWVIPFGRYLKVDSVIGTRIETDSHGILTGRFLTANCYGEEKVKRLQEKLTERSACYLIAYGDSKGDRELLEYADKGYYKYFK